MKLLLSLVPLAVMNTASWVLLALLVLAVVLVVIYLIRAKKKGKNICSCGGDCSSCSSAGFCHQQKSNDKSS